MTSDVSNVNVDGVNVNVNVTDADGDVSNADRQAAQQKVSDAAETWIQNFENANTDGSIDNAIATWQTGGTISEDDFHKLSVLSKELSPAEMQQLVSEGKLTQDQANAMIMIQGMQASMCPVSDDATQQAMVNFYRLSPDDQAFALEKMTAHQVDHTVHYNSSGDAILQRNNHVGDKQQQLVAYYLSTVPTDQDLNSFQDVVNGVNEFDDPSAQLIYSMDSYRRMTPDQQDAMTKYMNEAAMIPMKDGQLDITDPVETKKDIDNVMSSGDQDTIDELENVSIATLYFLICQNNTKITGDSIRTKGIQQMNDMNDYGDMVDCMAAMSAAENPDSDKDTDLSDVTFTDHNGNTVNCLDWCSDHGLDVPEGKLNDQEQMEDAAVNGTDYDSGNDPFKQVEYKAISDSVDKMDDETKQKVNNGLDKKKKTLSGTQMDTFMNTMKSWSGKKRDGNQLEQNELSRDTQLFQQYVTQGTQGMQTFTDMIMKAIQAQKVQG